MTATQALDAAAEVRQWRIGRAVAEVVWLIDIRARLRAGPATTRVLADVCGVSAGREFASFVHFLRKVPLKRVGLVTGHTGHLNILWALAGEVAP